MISILLPSRGRPTELQTSLNSLNLNDQIEVLVWLDTDDPFLNKYLEILKPNPHVKVFVKDRVGYSQFFIMNNFLISQAKFDWFFLFNDDAFMDNPDWLKVFKNFVRPFEPKNQPVVINIWDGGPGARNLFPIVSRKFVDILGHLSLSAACDDWIRRIAAATNINYELEGIKPKHRKYEGDDILKDQTYLDVENDRKKYGRDWNLRINREGRKLLEQDIKKINDYKASPELCKNCSTIKTIGFIGLGKLGLLVAEAVAARGYKVIGYDIKPVKTSLPVATSIEDLVLKSDLVFCAVQTPHESLYEGHRPLTPDRADFDYSYLIKAVKDVVAVKKDTTLVVISTCLPGTYERDIKPLLTKRIKYIYNPFFIAMGTVVQDFMNPEFVLIGGEDTAILRHFYINIHGHDRTFVTDITTAEGIKVFYNTFITTKTVLANMYGEFAHKTGMNVDHIFAALSKATDRIISPRYLRSGVGDGGGCHPRDNIALSYLAKNLDISFNYFDSLMMAREKHMEWLADVFIQNMNEYGLDGVIFGKSFKPETDIQTGSAAILLSNLLSIKKAHFSHYEFDYPKDLPVAVYFIATEHKEYQKIKFPMGSIVIDPFRYIPVQSGIKLIPIGKKA